MKEQEELTEGTEYFATGYTREELKVMHPNVALKPERRPHELELLKATLKKLCELLCEPLHDCDDDAAIELISNRIEELEEEIEVKT